MSDPLQAPCLTPAEKAEAAKSTFNLYKYAPKHGSSRQLPKNGPASQGHTPSTTELYNYDDHFGGSKVNRYHDGITKGELFIGMQKLKYGQDGTWHGMQGYFIDPTQYGNYGGCHLGDAPIGSDQMHPRMRSGKPDFGFVNDGTHNGGGHGNQDCGVQMKRFFICAYDLPMQSALHQCKKEFMNFRLCTKAQFKKDVSFKFNLQSQLKNFSKAINDEYFDWTSICHFNYGDLHTAERVGQAHERMYTQDHMILDNMSDRYM